MMSCEFTACLKGGGSCYAILKLCGGHHAARVPRIGPAAREHSAKHRIGPPFSKHEWLHVSGEMMAGVESGCGYFGSCLQMRFLSGEAATSHLRASLSKARLRSPAWASARRAFLPERDGSPHAQILRLV
jgi:hypothetical protein